MNSRSSWNLIKHLGQRLDRPRAIKTCVKLNLTRFFSPCVPCGKTRTHVPEPNIQLFYFTKWKVSTDSPAHFSSEPSWISKQFEVSAEGKQTPGGTFFYFVFSNCNLSLSSICCFLSFFPPTQAKSATWERRMRGWPLYWRFINYENSTMGGGFSWLTFDCVWHSTEYDFLKKTLPANPSWCGCMPQHW